MNIFRTRRTVWERGSELYVRDYWYYWVTQAPKSNLPRCLYVHVTQTMYRDTICIRIRSSVPEKRTGICPIPELDIPKENVIELCICDVHSRMQFQIGMSQTGIMHHYAWFSEPHFPFFIRLGFGWIETPSQSWISSLGWVVHPSNSGMG